MTTRVSVCIPAYQSAAFLAATVRSVLAQDLPELEIVVLDNASTDGTRELLEAFDDPRLHIISATETVDLPTNWRRAVEATSGELVKLLCADDLIAPDALSRQQAVLREHPEVAVVASRRALIDAEGRILTRGMGLRGLLGIHPGRAVARTIVRRGGINPVGEPGNVMFRRADYDAVGGWNPARVHPMDVDLWMRLLHRGDLCGQPEELAAFRASDASHSAAHSQEQYAEYAGFSRDVAADWSVAWPERTAGAIVRRASWQLWPLRKRSMRPGARWTGAEGSA